MLYTLLLEDLRFLRPGHPALSISAVTSAVEFLASCDVVAVRLHAVRTLPCARRLGTVKALREDAERDMFARDVRELFLLPYAEARRHGRLRGRAAGILGPVLSGNAAVALDALLARGCQDPSRALDFVLDDMLSRAHRRGFFYEPYHEAEVRRVDGRPSESRFLLATATYVRFLNAFGRGRDPRVHRALDWFALQQEEDGTWRRRNTPEAQHDTHNYLLTRSAALVLADLPIRSVRRYAETRRRLATAWADRILIDCEEPDAVITRLNIASDPMGPNRGGPMPELPASLQQRILYFPLEDLWLAVKLGAAPKHAHLAPWIDWLRESQLADGSWRLGDPALRERLLLSDPNGRLRAEALYLTDEWITLRSAQILQLAGRRARTTAAVPASV